MTESGGLSDSSTSATSVTVSSVVTTVGSASMARLVQTVIRGSVVKKMYPVWFLKFKTILYIHPDASLELQKSAALLLVGCVLPLSLVLGGVWT